MLPPRLAQGFSSAMLIHHIAVKHIERHKPSDRKSECKVLGYMVEILPLRAYQQV